MVHAGTWGSADRRAAEFRLDIQRATRVVEGTIGLADDYRPAGGAGDFYRRRQPGIPDSGIERTSAMPNGFIMSAATVFLKPLAQMVAIF